ncbi:MAG: SurA N-terminal domain-containing protein, partial [Luteolibacter sp.]
MNPRLALPSAIFCAILSHQGVSAQQAPPQAPQAPTMPRPTGAIEVNGISAKVNGRVITKNEVAFMLSPVFAQLSTQFPRRGPQFEAKFKESKANIIQELIDREIILDEFKQLGAVIKPNLIDEEIKRQMRDLYNGDEVKFREELKRSR